MPYGSVNADLVVGTNGGKISPENTFGFRNRIINGAMVIDQRNAGASVAFGTTYAYYLDRWQGILASGSGSPTVQQSTSAPTGFNYSLLVTNGTGASPAAGARNAFVYSIEGYNVADLGWGTANAKTVTLSFWVQSSVTGTFSGAFQNGTSARSYPFTYTINSASTWEQKTLTVVGDTSGTWNTTNGNGMQIWFDLGTGSTYQGTAGAWAAGDYRAVTGSVKLVSTTSANIYITGVQLEVGSNATSFDYRPYGAELVLCQRYYEKSYDIGIVPGTSSDAGIRLASNSASFTNGSTTRNFVMSGNFSVIKRASPTIVFYTNAGTVGNIAGYSSATNYAVSSYNGQGQSALGTYITTATSASTSEISTFHFTASSEL
jgi:hypothetical protein